MMNLTVRYAKDLVLAVLIFTTAVVSAAAQNPSGTALNDAYLTKPSPVGVTVSNRPLTETSRNVTQIVSEIKAAAVHPSSLYRIGAGDLIKIDLKNSTNGVRYLKVAIDGCIDFRLAGEGVCVAGLTVKEAAAMLTQSIKLFADPKVTVDVLDFASHVITIAGLVEQPGQQQIQRDAVPFFVVRAGVMLSSAAASVRVIRNASEITEMYDLSDKKLENVFIYPGDSVEFL